MVTGSVSASRASGIDAASSRPALAITTACNTERTRGWSMCFPEKCTSGMIMTAGVIMASQPAIAPGIGIPKPERE